MINLGAFTSHLVVACLATGPADASAIGCVDTRHRIFSLIYSNISLVCCPVCRVHGRSIKNAASARTWPPSEGHPRSPEGCTGPSLQQPPRTRCLRHALMDGTVTARTHVLASTDRGARTHLHPALPPARLAHVAKASPQPAAKPASTCGHRAHPSATKG